MAPGYNNVTREMFVLVILYVIIEVTNAQMGPLRMCNAYSRPAAGGVCGAGLDRALEFVCGKGNFGERSKRSLMDSTILDMNLADFVALAKQSAQKREQESAGHAMEDYFIQKASASKFLSKRIPFKQSGVACECCYNSCTVLELKSYCKDMSRALI